MGWGWGWEQWSCGVDRRGLGWDGGGSNGVSG